MSRVAAHERNRLKCASDVCSHAGTRGVKFRQEMKGSYLDLISRTCLRSLSCQPWWGALDMLQCCKHCLSEPLSAMQEVTLGSCVAM